MASYPRWSPDEFVLLMHTFLTRAAVSSGDVTQLSNLLRSQAPTRELAGDPGFRSSVAVWAQLDKLRGLARVAPSAYEEAPRTLIAVWESYTEDPESFLEQAEALRATFGARPAPFLETVHRGQRDQAQLRQFSNELMLLLSDLVGASGRFVTEDLDADFRAAWGDLEARRVFADLDVQLARTDLAEPLDRVGLIADQLVMKLNGWWRALAELRRLGTVAAAKFALGWANLITGSLKEVLPGVELAKEFKEEIELLLDGSGLPPDAPILLPA